MNELNRFGTAAILAGGKSSRMGFDKQFIEFDGENIVKRNAEILRAMFNQIIVVTNRPSLYNDSDCIETVKDIIFQKGPLSGIHSALSYSKSSYVYFLACDMPEIDLKFIEFMKSQVDSDDIEICIPLKEGRMELFNGFYSRSLIPRIEKLLEEEKRAIRNLVEESNSKIIDIDERAEDKIFLNLNTQKELEDYRKLKSSK